MAQIFLIKLTKMIGVVFLVIGIGVFILAVLSAISTIILVAKSRVTQGEIADFITTTRIERGKTIQGKFPVVKFYDQNGILIQYKSSFMATGNMFIGQKVEVRYLPEKPAEAKISSSFWQMWGLSVILGIMGVVFAGLGLLVFRLNLWM